MVKGLRLLGADSLEYPVGLRDLEEQPSIYVVGELGEAAGVALVGTRRCTRYGIDLAKAFGAAIARSGWSVVSGLARGIDAAGHLGCLDAAGHAVGVLGCGVDVRYPLENAGLYQRIERSGGALVSEYPPGTPPDRWRFPARNRLIAAMSAAVVVVEAAEKGGALITARLAAEIGRAVLAVPGDVDRPASVGCNRLIRDGAIPVLGSEDLIEALSLIAGRPPVTPESGSNPGQIPTGGVTIDELAVIWGVSPGELLIRIGRMELDGQLRVEGDRVIPA